MIITATEEFTGRLAAVVGTLQGLVWSGLSLTCIILYNMDYTVEKPSTATYRVLLEFSLNEFYIRKNSTVSTDHVIRPRDFTILMWFYFFISVALLAASVDLFFAIHRKHSRQSKMMVIWGLITSANSVVDLVFSSLLLRDFVNCFPYKIEQAYEMAESFACHTTIGIAMTLAARGYVLWVLNVFLSYVTISNGLKIITMDKIKGAVKGFKIPRAQIPQQTPTTVYPNYPSSASGTSMTPVSQAPMFTNYPDTTVGQAPHFQNNPGEFSRNSNRFAF